LAYMDVSFWRTGHNVVIFMVDHKPSYGTYAVPDCDDSLHSVLIIFMHAACCNCAKKKKGCNLQNVAGPAGQSSKSKS